MAVVIRKKDRVPYLYKGNRIFKNIHTEVEKEVEAEVASKAFTIHPALTALISEFPLIEKFINVLELRIEHESK